MPLTDRLSLAHRLRPTPRWLRRPAVADAALGLFVFSFALAFYNATLTPSLSYVSPDGNELVTVAHRLNLAHMTGYPLYTWLGKLFTLLPVGDIAHRTNLMSAVGAAGTAAFLFGSLRLLGAGRIAALFGAFFLAFSTTLWSQAVITEVYAPNAFMLSLVLLLAIAWGRAERSGASPRRARRPALLLFWGLCLVYSLSLGIHLSNLALAPALALYVPLVNWRVLLQPRVLLPGAALFGLGLLQYLWLPARADTLLDVPMQRNAPDDVEAFYNYTLNAFPQMKFAFPWEAIPQRIVLYLQLTRANFGYLGIALGLLGMWEMLGRRPREFFLLTVFYLIQVAFFIEYRVLDLDVFFIPAHMVMALFAGFAVHRLLVYVPRLASRVRLARPAYAGLAALAVLPVLVLIGKNSEANDQSYNTAVNDFYEEVFDRLPQDSMLVGLRGVFGYDMFYYRLVYDPRPDVLIPLADDPAGIPNDTDGRPLYATIRPYTTMAANPFMPPPYLMQDDLWYVPVLVAPTDEGWFGRLRGSLTLYEVRSQRPELVVPEASPEHVVGYEFGGLQLVGFDIDKTEVAAGDTVHVAFYWRMTLAAPHIIVTTLGDSPYQERHPLGFGDLKRYADEFKPRGGFIKEEYDLLIPSSTEPGPQMLRIGLGRILPVEGEEETLIDLLQITVEEARE